jgi:hypothetical protein
MALKKWPGAIKHVAERTGYAVDPVHPCTYRRSSDRAAAKPPCRRAGPAHASCR